MSATTATTALGLTITPCNDRHLMPWGSQYHEACTNSGNAMLQHQEEELVRQADINKGWR